MAALLKTLHQDHKNYSVLLNLLKAETDRVDQGNDPDYVQIYDIANYMCSYPDLIHHPHEEFIFSILEALEPGCSAEIDKLSKEHKQLAVNGQALKDAVYGVMSGAIVPKKIVLDNARAYINLLWKHMNTEEGKVFPLANTLLSATDWQLIEEKLSQVEDPLFGDIVQSQFAKLYEGIMQNSGSASGQANQ